MLEEDCVLKADPVNDAARDRLLLVLRVLCNQHYGSTRSVLSRGTPAPCANCCRVLYVGEKQVEETTGRERGLGKTERREERVVGG